MKAKTRNILVAFAVVSTVVLIASSPIFISIWYHFFATNGVTIHNQSNQPLHDIEIAVALNRVTLATLPANNNTALTIEASGEGTVKLTFKHGHISRDCEVGYVDSGTSTRTIFWIKPDGNIEYAFWYPGIRRDYEKRLCSQ